MKTLDAYNILLFDTETTGLSPISHYILQFSAIILNKSGNTYNIFNEYVAPPSGTIIENSHIHNITDEVLDVHNAVPFNAIFTRFQEWVVSYFGNDNVYMIAHNCHMFDMRFIEVECKRHGLSIPENWIFIDSLVQFRKYNADLDCDNYKLGTLFNAVKDETTIIDGDLHDSLTDVKVLRFVYLKLSSKFTQEQMNVILKEGHASIQYTDSYLNLPITQLMPFTPAHIKLMGNYNIVTIRNMISVYNKLTDGKELTPDRTPDRTPDKPFYHFLTNLSMPYIMRRELTSKVKYIDYMSRM